MKTSLRLIVLLMSLSLLMAGINGCEDKSTDPDDADLLEVKFINDEGSEFTISVIQLQSMGRAGEADSTPQGDWSSNILTGNELAMLGNLERIPKPAEIEEVKNTETVLAILKHPDDAESVLMTLARRQLREGNAYEALKILMI